MGVQGVTTGVPYREAQRLHFTGKGDKMMISEAIWEVDSDLTSATGEENGLVSSLDAFKLLYENDLGLPDFVAVDYKKVSGNRDPGLLRNNRVVILSAGTGNPFFTTDSAACLRGIEIEADVVLKATKVDGVFTADPAKDPTATMYEQLTYSEVLEKELKVMDLAAFTLARDHKLPIRVFNMNKPGALRRVVMGEKEGTLITE